MLEGGGQEQGAGQYWPGCEPEWWKDSKEVLAAVLLSASRLEGQVVIIGLPMNGW